MKEAVIHIGTEKTGSTTIQHFLAINRVALARSNIFFPRSPGSENQLKLAAYCVGKNPDPEQKSLLSLVGLHNSQQHKSWKISFHSALHREMEELPADAQVVFSSEHLQSRVKDGSEISALKDLLDPHFNSIKIVVYLRRQDLLASSLYNEALKSGSVGKRPLRGHGKIDKQFFDYCMLLDRWSAVFGAENVIPRIFEKNRFVDGELISDFCHACRIPHDYRFKIPESRNVALQTETIYILIRFNQICGLTNKEGPTYTALRKYIIQSQSTKSCIPANTPTRQEAEAYLRTWRTKNLELADKWFDGAQFSSDMSMYPDASAEAPAQTVVNHLLIQKIEDFCTLAKTRASTITLDAADIHRDVAILMEHLDLELAVKHMRAAQSLRPEGPYIQQKLKQYQKLNKSR